MTARETLVISYRGQSIRVEEVDEIGGHFDEETPSK